MNEYGVDELVLLALASEFEPTEAGSGGATASALADALGYAASLADRLSLLSTVSSLIGDGLVAEETRRIDEREGERSVYRLTPAGRERARTLRAAVDDAPVTVVAGGAEIECSLGAVPERFGLSVPEALVRRSPGGVLSLDEPADDALVGRDAELDRLDTALDRVRDGPARTVAVSGDDGVGKTALVEAFVERARAAGVDVLVGWSRRDGGRAYGPIREALRAPFESLAAPFDALDHPGARFAQRRTALYNDVTDRLRAHADATPTVLVIEDLHWADAATIDLLAHVVTAATDASLLLVATYRPDGVDDEHPLLERVGDAEGLAPLELEPFDRRETARLVESEVGRRGVPDPFVDAIYEATGGNPRFVVETIAHLRETGSLDPRIDRYPDAVADLEIPSVVETAVERRFDGLDETTARVCSVGAVLGDPIPIDLLVDLVPAPEPRVRERIDLLVDAGFLQRGDDGRLRFRSEVVRSTALATIDRDRRRALHRTAATVRADRGDARPATIAAHAERAGDLDRALAYYRRAADEATEVYAHEVAIDHYERALGLARDLDRGSVVLDVLEAIARIYYTRGDYEDADRYVRYVRDRTDDPERIRRSYYYQSRSRFVRGEYDAAESLARRGLAVGGEEITEAVCLLTDYLGSAYFGRGEYEAAIEHHERLRDRARAIDYTRELGRAYQNLGDCYARLGEMDRAIDLLGRAVDLLEDADDERELAICLNDLGVTYKRIGATADAVDALERCARLAERTGDVPTKALATMNLGYFMIDRGAYESALEYNDRCRQFAERIDDCTTSAVTTVHRSLIECEIGDVSVAAEELEAALERLETTGSNRRIVQTRWRLGGVAVLLGDEERARRLLERALEGAIEHDFPTLRGNCEASLGAVEREFGSLERAAALGRQALDRAEDTHDASIRHRRAEQLARTLLRRGEVDEALDLSRMARRSIPSGQARHAVKIDATYGRARLASGDRDGARETLTAALERARGLSNEARLVALCGLGRLEWVAGNHQRAAARFGTGRRVAADTGHELHRGRFEAALADLDGETVSPGE
ncbi:ATP-binding protein [Halovivax limisalsi]|uniref:ATP-binding protein n=1 Tax=Halovivax limisalsi TaxID=1453760 RepID=UPI001FFC5DCD|nr:tetratricopeptide repeat protein [Halovivax limisalsi]